MRGHPGGLYLCSEWCGVDFIGCLFFFLPTFGFLSMVAGSFWGSTGYPMGGGGEAPVAMPPCPVKGTGSGQLAETRRADQGQSGATGLVWTGGKQTGFLPSFGSVQSQS